MMNPCRECVFCGRLAERNQRACGCYDDDVARVRACVLASMNEKCADKLTLGDVQEMRRQLLALEERRRRDSAALVNAERVLVEVSGLIAELRAEETVTKEGLDDPPA